MNFMKDTKSIEVKIKFTEHNRDKKLPFYATEGSAGMDLSACISEDIILPPLGRTLVPTGIAISLPSPEYGAFVYARSGLAIKKGITLANCVGVIDSDYTGEIKVGLINLSNEVFTIKNGERIAQLVIMPVSQVKLTPVDKLDETERGAGGFGSTGMN